ncbi:hypothetical protein [Crocosphaera sp.]|uniref:hypothetical protein n=1 Tax=Crocosphaera sp. TaxID=2729996 RepID=UPI003F26A227|nr:hypothetical protein [Crocosphaera sp.]
MRIVSKLEIITVVTLLSLVFGNQSAFSQNNGINQLETVKNQERKTILTKIENNDIISSQEVVTVNNSLISLPIPEPLGILCLLGMVGVSSFLKLTIAKIKYEKQSEDKKQPQKTDFTEPSQQLTES